MINVAFHISHLKTELTSRTIVISDIHGHLEMLKKLLEKVNYTNEDTLIINGDMIEKGPYILDTLHYVEKLRNENQHVYVLNGNCEWAIYAIVKDPKAASFFHQYLDKQPYSIFHEKERIDGIDVNDYTGIQLQEYFNESLKHELDLIDSFYTTVDTEDYLFVHAGIEDRVDFENSTLHMLLEQQRFYESHHPLNKYVVVGHLPTSNYHTRHIDNSIMISPEKKIISIDGGMGVKKIGQLNALIIDNDQLECVEVHPDYPKGVLIEDDHVDEYHHHKICWPDYELELIAQGDEFTYCKKVNQEKLYVKNELIEYKDGKYYGSDDYEDYRMSLKKGAIVEILGKYGNYYYCKYGKEVLWVPSQVVNIIGG